MTTKMVFCAALMCAAAAAAANQTHDMLMASSDTKRATALAKWLASNGENCPSVSRTFYQGSDNRDAAYWNAECAGGKSYQIQFPGSTSASPKLMDCAILKAVNGGKCFSKFK